MAVTVLLPVALRGPGAAISGVHTVPAGANTCRTCGVLRADHDTLSPDHAFVLKRALFQMNIPDPDRQDPAKTVTLGVQRNVAEPGQPASWKTEATVGYAGIPSGAPGYFKMDGATRSDLPGIMLSGEEYAGVQIRLGLNITGPAMQIGVQVDVI